MLRGPSSSTLFPYTTLFRSGWWPSAIPRRAGGDGGRASSCAARGRWRLSARRSSARSEEHTSELQSHSDLVCRLLLEKKKKIILYLFLVMIIVQRPRHKI